MPRPHHVACPAGANHAADPIVTRFDPASGRLQATAVTRIVLILLITIMSPASGRLQVAAIIRSDNGVIALPGGMVDAGEIVSATVRREFAEEVLNLPSEARAARVHTRSECTSTAATL